MQLLPKDPFLDISHLPGNLVNIVCMVDNDNDDIINLLHSVKREN